MSRSDVHFSVDFRKYFRLANLLQRTELQDILKTVDRIYMEDLRGIVLDCISFICEIIEIWQRTIRADSEGVGGATSKYIYIYIYI